MTMTGHQKLAGHDRTTLSRSRSHSLALARISYKKPTFILTFIPHEHKLNCLSSYRDHHSKLITQYYSFIMNFVSHDSDFLIFNNNTLLINYNLRVLAEFVEGGWNLMKSAQISIVLLTRALAVALRI